MNARARKTLLALVLGSCAGLAGCFETTASIQPWFPAASAEVVDGIEGRWVSPDEDLELRIHLGEGGAYEIDVLEDGQPSADSGPFEMRFARVGDELFWDMRPLDRKAGSRLGMFALHLPARVRLEEAALEVSFLDPEALARTVASGEVELAHTAADHALVLTGSTEELLSFLRQHGHRDEVFAEAMTFSRRALISAHPVQ
jgi:hypothetical protein